MESKDWSPSSWKECPVKQEVVYKDQEKLSQVLNRLERLPPLVASTGIQETGRQETNLCCRNR